MATFISKFDPRRQDHRAQMIIWLIALAREVKNGPSGPAFRAKPFQTAKEYGWIPKTCRTKAQGFVYLVDLATQGFGYVPQSTVKEQYLALTAPKPNQKA
jgi:hypothetical protein